MLSVTKEQKNDSLEDELIPFHLELNSVYAMNSNNKLIINYSTNLTIHAHLIRFKVFLTKLLKLPNMLQIDWKLRVTIVHRLSKHLHLWLSKILLNFSGTAHQLHRQKLCNSYI